MAGDPEKDGIHGFDASIAVASLCKFCNSLRHMGGSSRMIQLGALPVAVLGIEALASRAPAPSQWSCVAWILATSYAFLCLTSAFHETAHGTLTGWPLFDRFFGRFLGAAMNVPYTAYCATHAR